MSAHAEDPIVAATYLEELACRAVFSETPRDLPLDDPAEYELRKRECLPNLVSMRQLLQSNPLLQKLTAEAAKLPLGDLDGLVMYAMQHDLPAESQVADRTYWRCKQSPDLSPMVTLLKNNPPLQQRLAFALDYVPSRWLLGMEIPSVLMRRRLLDTSLPDLKSSYGNVPLARGHRDAYGWARENKLAGICLSGGGIRSATFSLGVLQGLSALGVLGEFDYLSSVSGGGYIHEWLAAWIKREDVRSQSEGAGAKFPNGFLSVADAIKPLPVDAGHPFTPEPIRWLRRYSNYLTPQKGLFTADTWVAVAIWVRNTFLNQIVLVSFLFWLMLLPQFLVRAHADSEVPADEPLFLPVLAGALFLLATNMLCRGLHHELARVRYADQHGSAAPQVQHALVGELAGVVLLVFPLLLAAFSISQFLAFGDVTKSFVAGFYGLLALQLGCMAIAGGVVPAYCANHGLLHLLHREKGRGAEKKHENAGMWRRACAAVREFFRDAQGLRLSHLAGWRKTRLMKLWGPVLLGPILGQAVLGSLFAALGGLGVFFLVGALLHFPHFPTVEALTFHIPAFLRSRDEVSRTWKAQLTFGPPALVLVPFFSIVLMAGLVGRNFPDWLREWIARIRAWCLLLGLGWMVFLGIALFGPNLVMWLGSDDHVFKKTVASIKWTALIGWVATTVSGVLAAKSKKVAGTDEDSSVALKVVALAGPYVFLAGLLLLLSYVAERAYVHSFLVEPRWLAVGALAIGPLALFGIFGWRVDVNEFSMNPFYRNRLTRCYLGASNAKRDPNPLTGLDDRDTRGLQVYRFQPAEGYSGPLPIINTTVNLSFGEDLAYQERKAASFFFSPLFSGYTVGWTSGKSSTKRLSFNGFVPTKQFYGPDGGINIATAAAISGAAASPNAGFHTNPVTAFLMTLFNVRLGWWIANPRRSLLAGCAPSAEPVTPDWPSPKFAPVQLGSELLGMTTDTSRYVYLSDGGHFDNMGLYELVRRRCHRIVICDAECDENYTFEGLGMAIRKCRIDFGVEIQLKDMARLRRQIHTGNCKAHFALGTIRYPESPVLGKQEDGTPKTYSVGTVLYIKSSISGDAKWKEDPKAHEFVSLDSESVDILNYRLQHKTFPHDTTGNQWFTESQFESYRRLGQHVVEEIKCCKGWNDFIKPKQVAGLEKTDAPLVVQTKPSDGGDDGKPKTPANGSGPGLPADEPEPKILG